MRLLSHLCRSLSSFVTKSWTDGDTRAVMAYIDIITSILPLVTTVVALAWAIYRFGLARERWTFVRMSMEVRPVQESAGLVLVAVTVHLENKGNTRVDARQKRSEGGYLYNAGPDTCLHAGTLKIRAVPLEKEPLLFDWYSLQPLRLTTRLVPKEKVIVCEADLEQINYLDEFQDPDTDYREVDFWLEPHESYDLTVPVWLRPGTYAAKAFFLGPVTKHHEEEYWSCQTVFTTKEPAQPLVPAAGAT